MSRSKPGPMAVALEWVSRITVVGFEMVLPGVAGHWLDERLGTGPYLALAGFGLGITAGMWHLILMTRPRNRGAGQDQNLS